jgi:hypothetical protein
MVASVRRRLILPAALLALALGLAACGPEADRDRGGGDGADVGNVDEDVELHGEDPPVERIYYQTPLDPPVE